MSNEVEKQASLADITKALEQAVAAIEGRRAAAEAAKRASDAAAADYARALATARELHNAYSQHMSTVLSGHGQIHK